MMSLFRSQGIKGWRRQIKVFGKPDFVFRKERVVVFVDGCFWHGCPRPKHAPMPKHRAEWWAAKFKRNKYRDQLVTRTLRQKGWTVIRVWECDLTKKRARFPIQRIQRALAQYHERLPATGED
jgi:DNA mismatch endonuclease (patch repair protein)